MKVYSKKDRTNCYFNGQRRICHAYIKNKYDYLPKLEKQSKSFINIIKRRQKTHQSHTIFEGKMTTMKKLIMPIYLCLFTSVVAAEHEMNPPNMPPEFNYVLELRACNMCTTERVNSYLKNTLELDYMPTRKKILNQMNLFTWLHIFLTRN